jgi:hypothetical protein
LWGLEAAGENGLNVQTPGLLAEEEGEAAEVEAADRGLWVGEAGGQGPVRRE